VAAGACFALEAEKTRGGLERVRVHQTGETVLSPKPAHASNGSLGGGELGRAAAGALPSATRGSLEETEGRCSPVGNRGGGGELGERRFSRRKGPLPASVRVQAGTVGRPTQRKEDCSATAKADQCGLGRPRSGRTATSEREKSKGKN